MKKIYAALFLIFAFTGSSFAFEDIFVEEKPPITQQAAPNEQKIADIPFDWFDISAEEKNKQN